MSAAFGLGAVVCCRNFEERSKTRSKAADRSARSTGSMVAIQNSAGFVTFAVKVHPRAKKNAITGTVGDALKLSLTAPPVDGKANEACIDFFAKLLEVPRSSVTIAAGQSGRNKVIRVEGWSAEEMRRRLCL
ncbi:MAG: DUF167 domain-containing protein [Terriglobales bacterium]